jgi:hypothetical protein
MSEHTVLTLLGISGVSATFAGFSGVVAAFERRARGDWRPEEHFRLINMVALSLVTCLFAFVPLVEELFRISESALWGTASLLMGGFCAAYVLCAIPRRLRLRRSRPGVLPLWATVVFVLCLSSAAGLQILNAAAKPVGCEGALYVAGLLLLLVAAGFQFAFLILAPLSPAKREDHTA